jgi:acetyltransferase-like isoleucine patch superfamily enzyme
MSVANQVEVFVFRGLRRLVVRPLQAWRDRLEVIEQLESLKFLGKGVAVNGPIYLGNPTGIQLSEDVSINAGLVVRGSGALRVGAHVHFGEHVEVLTSNHNFERPTMLPYDHVRNAADVEIGDCVWICDRVTILPGAKIGEGAILAAGAVVSGRVAPLAIVGGSPARLIRSRDEQSYWKLRRANLYLGWPRDYDLVNGRQVALRRAGRGPSLEVNQETSVSKVGDGQTSTT